MRILTEGKVTGRKRASNGNHRGFYGSISIPCAQCRADEQCSVTIWQQMELGTLPEQKARLEVRMQGDVWAGSGHTHSALPPAASLSWQRRE